MIRHVLTVPLVPMYYVRTSIRTSTSTRFFNWALGSECDIGKLENWKIGKLENTPTFLFLLLS